MKPLIVALDVETAKEAVDLTKRLRRHVDLFKVGPVLFLKYGGTLLQDLRGLGAEIFLDLKFHDIPSVVAKAIERAAEWGVYSATIHTSGGAEMMRQAAAVSKRPILWGVTVLTSLDDADLRTIGIARPVAEQAAALAQTALRSGLDGVISSVQEAAEIKRLCGKSFHVVTPGIRAGASSDDQKRAQTPKEAREQGADFFVMGRPIVEAGDPEKAVRDVYDSIGLVI
jgi:orotidine-5'-phosphate decarboxylase